MGCWSKVRLELNQLVNRQFETDEFPRLFSCASYPGSRAMLTTGIGKVWFAGVL